MKRLIVAILLFTSPCFAQQSSQANLALQINQAIGQMALSSDQKDQIIANLQKQIADKDVKIKELEDKLKDKQ